MIIHQGDRTMYSKMNFKKYENVSDVNEDVLELWKEKGLAIQKIMDDINSKKSNKPMINGSSGPEQEFLLYPLLYNQFLQDRILFIGMNPSFSGKGFDTVAKRLFQNEIVLYTDLDWEKYFRWNNHSTFDPNVALKIDNASRNIYSHYFSKFGEISEFVYGDDSRWEHLDLFFMRMTSQSRMLEILNKDKDFEKKQLELSLSLIQLIKPTIIIIANAGAAAKLDEYGLMTEESDTSFHRYLKGVPGAEGIPLLYTSMLTGQRALDRGSLETYKKVAKLTLFGKIIWNYESSSQRK